MTKLTSVGNIVEMGGWLDRLQLATDVIVLHLVAQVGHSRVSGVVGTEDVDRLLNLVGLVDVLDYRVCMSVNPSKTLMEMLLTGDDGKGLIVTWVTKSDTGTRRDLLRGNVLLGHIEGDGHPKHGTISETESVDNTGVVCLVHEALEGGEASIDDELEIAELTLYRMIS